MAKFVATHHHSDIFAILGKKCIGPDSCYETRRDKSLFKTRSEKKM